MRPAKRNPHFGFRWFVPELLKHKSIWRDVLVASLAIQLMALATPLFTQAIIDKVVVHHTMSTLTVIGIALAVFMLFTAIMTWVRQYLVIHTGNRVDAVLGTQVFSHLFKLPTRYFEQRPTGVVVARMHAIEDIREFITGAAVTLILDFPFLLIFLGIMFYYSVPLTLLSLTLLSVIVGLSFIVAPMFRARLNQQFLLGARNQAFLTEYVSGMETVKSLQMEPQLNSKYGNYMADYLQAGFKTKALGNTYNTIANTLEQGMTLGHPVCRRLSGHEPPGLQYRHAGGVSDVCRQTQSTAAQTGRSVATIPAGQYLGETLRRCAQCANGALFVNPRPRRQRRREDRDQEPGVSLCR